MSVRYLSWRRKRDADVSIDTFFCFSVLSLCKNDDAQHASVLIVKNSSLDNIESFVKFRRRPYAVKEQDGSPSRPTCFSEAQEVLRRLATKLWPSPLSIYVPVTPGTESMLPNQLLHSEGGNQQFLCLEHPSHPLTSKVLKNLESSRGLVVGMPVRNSKRQCLTNASEASAHFLTHFGREKRIVYVLNGEDRRELFSVPPCQHGRPPSCSLWIDVSARAVYIRGERDDNSTTELKKKIHKALSANPVTGSASEVSDKTRNRYRVVTAVLRKWSAVDQRK